MTIYPYYLAAKHTNAMELLLIHQAFVGPDQPGGTRHFELASHLVRQGDGVAIVASDLSYLTGQKTTSGRGFIQREQIGDIRVLRAYTHPTLHRGFVWRVFSFVTFMCTSIWAGWKAGKPDLVMGTSPPLFQAVSAWFVSALRRRPLLLEIRDLWPEFAIEMGVLTSPVLIRLSRWLERFLYARATHLLVNSPAYRDYLINKGIPAEKVTLIPNGVDPDMFPADADGSRFRDSLSLGEKFVITYAGALGMANDIGTILRAAERLRDTPEIHFVLIGDGKERPRLEEQARSMELTNVTFAGLRPKSEMAQVLAGSDACVATLQNIPLFRTTYPNKIFDYMAARRPTILAIDGVIRDVVEAAEAGIFVPPGDDVRLAEAARFLYQNRAEAQAMGQRGRAHVEEYFNRHQQAADFADLVHRLTDTGTASLRPAVAATSPEARESR